jgi:hypothetical protein
MCHVFNQTGSHRSMNLLDILCDNQSTCDVIVDGSMVINIRKSRLTLRLRTQAGECQINHIADMPVVGTGMVLSRWCGLHIVAT